MSAAQWGQKGTVTLPLSFPLNWCPLCLHCYLSILFCHWTTMLFDHLYCTFLFLTFHSLIPFCFSRFLPHLAPLRVIRSEKQGTMLTTTPCDSVLSLEGTPVRRNSWGRQSSCFSVVAEDSAVSVLVGTIMLLFLALLGLGPAAS